MDKNSNSFSYFDKEDIGLGIDIITAIEIDSFNNVWIGVYGIGCAKYDETQWIAFTPDNSDIPEGFASAIKCAGYDTLFFGLNPYFAMFNGQNWNSFKTGSPWASYINLSDIEIDLSGNIWISASWGLGFFDGDSLYENYANLHDMYKNYFNCLEIDSGDTLWIGMDKYGLLKYKDSIVTCYNYSNTSMPDGCIYGMKFDTNGDLWMAMTGGLVHYDHKNFTVYDTSNSGLKSNELLSLEIANDGKIWIGTMKGLYSFDGDTTWKCYLMKPTAIGENASKPHDLELIFNNPNPFNSVTKINYTIHNPGIIKIIIYSILGKRIKSLYSGYQTSGQKQIIWDGTNDLGQSVSTGLYIVNLVTESGINWNKMLLIR